MPHLSRTVVKVIGLGTKSRARLLTMTKELRLLGLEKDALVLVDVYGDPEPRIEIHPLTDQNLGTILPKKDR